MIEAPPRLSPGLGSRHPGNFPSRACNSEISQDRLPSARLLISGGTRYATVPARNEELVPLHVAVQWGQLERSGGAVTEKLGK